MDSDPLTTGFREQLGSASNASTDRWVDQHDTEELLHAEPFVRPFPERHNAEEAVHKYLLDVEGWHVEKTGEQLHQMRIDNQKLQLDIGAVRAQLVQANTQNQKLVDAISGLQQGVEGAHEQYEGLKADLGDEKANGRHLAEKAAQLESDLEAEREVAAKVKHDMQNSIDDASNKLEMEAKALNLCKTALQSCTTERDEAKKECERELAMLANVQRNNSFLRNERSELEGQVNKLKKQLMETSTAVEAKLTAAVKDNIELEAEVERLRTEMSDDQETFSNLASSMMSLAEKKSQQSASRLSSPPMSKKPRLDNFQPPEDVEQVNETSPRTPQSLVMGGGIYAASATALMNSLANESAPRKPRIPHIDPQPGQQQRTAEDETDVLGPSTQDAGNKLPALRSIRSNSATSLSYSQLPAFQRKEPNTQEGPTECMIQTKSSGIDESGRKRKVASMVNDAHDVPATSELGSKSSDVASIPKGSGKRDRPRQQ